MTGEIASADEVCSPEYWIRQVRGCVRFSAGVRTLHDAGVRLFAEVGPDAVLSAMAADCLAAMQTRFHHPRLLRS